MTGTHNLFLEKSTKIFFSKCKNLNLPAPHITFLNSMCLNVRWIPLSSKYSNDQTINNIHEDQSWFMIVNFEFFFSKCKNLNLPTHCIRFLRISFLLVSIGNHNGKRQTKAKHQRRNTDDETPKTKHRRQNNEDEKQYRKNN